MRRSRTPALLSTSHSSDQTSSSNMNTGSNTVPALLKELHALVLQMQVHSVLTYQGDRLSRSSYKMHTGYKGPQINFPKKIQAWLV